MNENKTLPEPEKEFETKNNKDYEIKAINSTVYSNKINN